MLIMPKKMRKFAGGGAMGAADSMGQSLNELRSSLDGIQGNLNGGSGGTGGGLGGSAGPPDIIQTDGGDLTHFGTQRKLFDNLGISQGLKSSEDSMNQLGIKSSAQLKRGGKVSSASRRADGIATKGKTRGKMC